MNIPNIDAMETDEIEAFRTYLMILSTYCGRIADAKRERLQGDIQEAQRHEFWAERLYKALPLNWRW